MSRHLFGPPNRPDLSDMQLLRKVPSTPPGHTSPANVVIAALAAGFPGAVPGPWIGGFAAPLLRRGGVVVAARWSSSSSNSRWKQRRSADIYQREAKVRGLKSRAAFKLIEVKEQPIKLALTLTLTPCPPFLIDGLETRARLGALANGRLTKEAGHRPPKQRWIQSIGSSGEARPWWTS